MIKENEFDTLAYGGVAGDTRNTSEFTNNISNIPVESEVFPNTYWFGWARPESLPSTVGMTKILKVGTRLTLVDVSKGSNYNVGYVGHRNISGNTTLDSSAFVYKDDKWQGYGGFAAALPNKITINQVSTQGWVRIWFWAIDLSSPQTFYSRGHKCSYDISIPDLIKWIENDEERELSFTGTTSPFTLKLKPSMLDENNRYIYETQYVSSEYSQDVTRIVMINSFEALHTNNDTNSSGSVNNLGSSGFQPVFQITSDLNATESYLKVDTGSFRRMNNSAVTDSQFYGINSVLITHDGAYFDNYTDQSFATANETGNLIGRFNGTIDLSDFDNNINLYENRTYIGIKAERYNKPGIKFMALIPCYSFDDLAKAAAFNMRMCIDGSISNIAESERVGVNSHFYYPEVLDTNEFTGRFVTDANEVNKATKLQPWQYAEDATTINTYNSETDKPDYDPDVPGGKNTYITSTPLTKPINNVYNKFNAMFALNAEEVQNIRTALWGNSEAAIEKLVEGLAFMGTKPMDALVGLRMYPFRVNPIGETKLTAIKLGNQILSYKESTSTGDIDHNCLGAVMDDTKANIELDLGSTIIYREFNNFLDVEPYTTAKLFVPFCGSTDINVADYIGKTISIKMIVDYTTGAAKAIIFRDGVIDFTMNGVVGVNIPISGSDASEYASAITNRLIGATSSVASSIGSAATGNLLGAATGAASAATQIATMPWKDQHIKSIGASSSATEIYMPTYAFITFTRQVANEPKNYGHTIGYACSRKAKVGSLGGFTVAENVDMTGFGSATQNEKDRIKQMLESGVYI